MASDTKIIKRIHDTGETTITLPPMKAPKWLQGFLDFMREQGVVGLSVGLILGVAGKSVVDSIVNNIFNPLIGLVSGGVSLENKTVCLNYVDGACKVGQSLNYGRFLSDLLSFMIIAAIVYFVVKGLKMDKIDKIDKTAKE